MARLRLTLRCSSSANHPPPLSQCGLLFLLSHLLYLTDPSTTFLTLLSSCSAQLKIVCPYARHCCHWLWPRSVGILSQIANEPSQTRHSNANVDMWMHSFDSWIRHSVSFPLPPPSPAPSLPHQKSISNYFKSLKRTWHFARQYFMNNSFHSDYHMAYAMHSLQYPSWEYQIWYT